MLTEEVIKERKLWVTVVSQGIRDLVSKNDTKVLEAVLYFFTKGYDTDLRTFNGICKAHDLDSEKAAKKVWSRLNSNQQKRIRNLLQRSDDKVKIN